MKDKDFRPIIGPLHTTYPLDTGWRIGDSKERIRLSQLTVRRITKAKRKTKGVPNSQKLWAQKLKIPELEDPKNWAILWKATGSFLLSGKDEKVIQKIMHKNLFLHSRDPSAKSKNCRVCKHHTENTEHVATCPDLRKVRDFARKLLHSIGSDLSSHDPLVTWLFASTMEDKIAKPLSETERAIVCLYWRALYKNLCLKDAKKISKVRPERQSSETSLTC